MADRNMDTLGNTDPPTQAQYDRAARTLAANTDNPGELRDWLEMIGYPLPEPPPKPFDPDLCQNQKHPRNEENRRDGRCLPWRRLRQKRLRAGQT